MKLRILVTGGPTRAYLDDIRFLTNVSSGELAFHLCQRLKEKRFSVEAVVGPTVFPFQFLKLKKLTKVETNDEMLKSVVERCRVFRPHIAIFSAAVLDFVPSRRKGKMSSKNNWRMNLKPSPKIIDLVDKKFPKIKKIGFKLEAKPVAKSKAVSMGKRLMQERELIGLCLNYSGEISSKKHRAMIFDKNGKVVRVKGKKEIAHTLAEICADARKGLY